MVIQIGNNVGLTNVASDHSASPMTKLQRDRLELIDSSPLENEQRQDDVVDNLLREEGGEVTQQSSLKSGLLGVQGEEAQRQATDELAYPVSRQRRGSYLDQLISDRYQVRELIGEGGFGQVYLARDLKLDKREVALKIIDMSMGRDQELLGLFKREASILARLHHPNIVTLYDIDTLASGQPVIITELLRGGTLSELITQRRTIHICEALRIVRVLASALHAAHEMGVIHRDLKPDNVILHRSLNMTLPTVKLIDFGIAKLRKGMMESVRKQVKVKSIFGTIYYMSPEQLRGDEWVDLRTDVYALGIMLYEMLSGECPFVSEHYEEIVQLHMKARLPEVELSIPTPILSQLNDFLQQMCHKTVKFRTPNMLAVKREIDALLVRLDEVGYSTPNQLNQPVWQSQRYEGQSKRSMLGWLGVSIGLAIGGLIFVLYLYLF